MFLAGFYCASCLVFLAIGCITGCSRGMAVRTESSCGGAASLAASEGRRGLVGPRLGAGSNSGERLLLRSAPNWEIDVFAADGDEPYVVFLIDHVDHDPSSANTDNVYRFATLPKGSDARYFQETAELRLRHFLQERLRGGGRRIRKNTSPGEADYDLFAIM
eukprot:TRINITY_DN112145_c0_g1_i1.p2 TRINITY_DN112145_c0_g1~~TRINITY_DN112145_c0_g1_i1.p2  ORF type:complete len:162 (+),score=20.91 TRINITY_DN112145_c0_g1_i1:263-748(+)